MLKLIVVCRVDLKMRKGKLAAQVGHASVNASQMTANNAQIVLEWLDNGQTKIVLGIDSEKELNDLILQAVTNEITINPIIDAGKTEFHGVPTLTCAAFGPDSSEKLDPLLGRLKLL